jgi:uncharacterized protein (DUF4415 family)
MTMKDQYDFSQAKRGSVNAPDAGKTRITIRLDADIIEHFKARCREGGSYQALINEALRAAINAEDLEATLRRVVREELTHAA